MTSTINALQVFVQHHTAKVTRLADFADQLLAGDTIAAISGEDEHGVELGVEEEDTSDLFVTGVVVFTHDGEGDAGLVDDEYVPSGVAVQFTARGGVAGATYWLRVTVLTTMDETLVMRCRLDVV